MEKLNITAGTFYVTCIDTFMSGWGHATGRINKLIFLCESPEDQEIVTENAMARKDQRDVRTYPPSDPPSDLRITKGKNYNLNTRSGSAKYVQIKTKDDYPSWYEKDYFKKQCYDNTIKKRFMEFVIKRMVQNGLKFTFIAWQNTIYC